MIDGRTFHLRVTVNRFGPDDLSVPYIDPDGEGLGTFYQIGFTRRYYLSHDRGMPTLSELRDAIYIFGLKIKINRAIRTDVYGPLDIRIGGNNTDVLSQLEEFQGLVLITMDDLRTYYRENIPERDRIRQDLCEIFREYDAVMNREYYSIQIVEEIPGSAPVEILRTNIFHKSRFDAEKITQNLVNHLHWRRLRFDQLPRLLSL